MEKIQDFIDLNKYPIFLRKATVQKRNGMKNSVRIKSNKNKLGFIKYVNRKFKSISRI